MLVVAEPMCWVGVVGLAENKANSAPIELELELGLSLAKRYWNNNFDILSICSAFSFIFKFNGQKMVIHLKLISK